MLVQRDGVIALSCYPRRIFYYDGDNSWETNKDLKQEHEIEIENNNKNNKNIKQIKTIKTRELKKTSA